MVGDEIKNTGKYAATEPTVDTKLEQTQPTLTKLQKTRAFIDARQEEFHFGHMLIFVYFTATLLVTLGSYLFYSDGRSKYDIVRPGRSLKTFNASVPEAAGVKQEKLSAESIKLELEALKKQQTDITNYGDFGPKELDYETLLPVKQ
jgi:hypothetical protein